MSASKEIPEGALHNPGVGNSDVPDPVIERWLWLIDTAHDRDVEDVCDLLDEFDIMKDPHSNDPAFEKLVVALLKVVSCRPQILAALNRIANGETVP